MLKEPKRIIAEEPRAPDYSPLCLHWITSSIHSSRERPGARLLLIMKPPSIVIDHFLSTKWSKKLFTINHYELQNGKCIVTQELSAYLRCTGFFCLAIIKGPPNDIYCIIEEPYKHYFTEKVSYSQVRPEERGNLNI